MLSTPLIICTVYSLYMNNLNAEPVKGTFCSDFFSYTVFKQCKNTLLPLHTLYAGKNANNFRLALCPCLIMTCNASLATALMLLYTCKQAGHIQIPGTRWDSPGTVKRDGQRNGEDVVCYVWNTLLCRRGLVVGNTTVAQKWIIRNCRIRAKNHNTQHL